MKSTTIHVYSNKIYSKPKHWKLIQILKYTQSSPSVLVDLFHMASFRQATPWVAAGTLWLLATRGIEAKVMKGTAKTLGVRHALPGSAVSKLDAGSVDFLKMNLWICHSRHSCAPIEQFSLLTKQYPDSPFLFDQSPGSSNYFYTKTQAKIRSTPGFLLLKFAARTLGPVNITKQFGFQRNQNNSTPPPLRVCNLAHIGTVMMPWKNGFSTVVSGQWWFKQPHIGTSIWC